MLLQGSSTSTSTSTLEMGGTGWVSHCSKNYRMFMLWHTMGKRAMIWAVNRLLSAWLGDKEENES